MEQGDRCTYCGTLSEIEREHVIPASYFGRRTNDDTKQWIVPACKDCNRLAGSATFFSIPEKAAYIVKRYKRRYSKALKVPLWTEQELKEISYKLRVRIEAAQEIKALLHRRLQYAEAISEMEFSYKRPAWVEKEERIWKERQRELLTWDKEFKKKRGLATRKAKRAKYVVTT